MSSATAAYVPTADLSTLHAHLRARLSELPLTADELASVKTRLAHVYAGDAPFVVTPSAQPLAALIDHTVLKADARLEDVQQLCSEAVTHQFASVCVNSSRVADCVTYFASSGGVAPRITAVVGFPLGAMVSAAKAFETTCALQAGASEIDMVINVGQLKDRNYRAVLDDILAVAEARRSAGATLKVILETCLLTPSEIIDVTLLCAVANVEFVKTSTGFSTGGATATDVRLMKSIVGDSAQVKASGGIRDAQTARIMVQNGATRLGCSASVAISQGDKQATQAAPATAGGY